MKALISLLFVITLPMTTIMDFSTNDAASQWYIVNDTVMGGLSSSKVESGSNGNLIFSGTVSTENNGGFCMTRCSTVNSSTKGKKHILIRLKGDGKQYQFRIKPEVSLYYSYVAEFSTTGEWQTVSIPLADMRPQFRGRILNQENFNADQIAELGILIGNKKNEDFKLELDWIGLE